MRFLSDLVNCHVIAAPSMVAMFENFVSVTQEEDVPQVRRKFKWLMKKNKSCAGLNFDLEYEKRSFKVY